MRRPIRSSGTRPPVAWTPTSTARPLWPLLEDIAHQTGWHIFVEPGTARNASTKFQDLPPDDALRMLLGNLNFAFVPQTNGPDFLYVFTTSRANATQPVRREKPVVKKQQHVPNELIVKLKPGADIDALAKLLGAKIIARYDKLGIYRLGFADAAATDAALANFRATAMSLPWITITFSIRRRLRR